MTEKHEEYLSTLKCDCCGKEIIDLRFPMAVLNLYECLCMECFRADYRENARVLKENANNYSLQKKLESYKDAYYCNLHTMEKNFKEINKKDVESMKDACNSKFKDMVDEAYYKAVATDSASAIALLTDLRDKTKELSE